MELMKGKVYPYKLAIALLYAYLPGINRIGARKYVISTTKLAEAMGVNNVRLREYMSDLKAWGIISELDLQQGHILLTLAPAITAQEHA